MATCESQKIKLATEIKKPLKENYLEEIPPIEKERVIVIPVTKLKLETFHGLVKNLRSTFFISFCSVYPH